MLLKLIKSYGGLLINFIKSYGFVLAIVIVTFSTHEFLITQKVQSLITEQTAIFVNGLSKVELKATNNTNTTNIQKCLPCNDGDLAKQNLRLSLRESLFVGKVFDDVLLALGITSDQYLREIASRGVVPAKDLQREFFVSLLPKIEMRGAININNNIIARWVDIKKKNVLIDTQMQNMRSEVSLQHFDNVINIIDSLPHSLQVDMQPWRQKVMDYIYLQEFLKIYLGRND